MLSHIYKFCLLIIFFHSNLQAKDINIATVDSGFGGYFTTKAIEEEALKVQRKYSNVSFSLTHFGDTANAPYGSKNPDEIALLASKMIILASKKGADHIFLACNTASSQYDKIIKILKSNPNTSPIADKTYSIIESSLYHLKRSIDSLLKNRNEVTIAILSTPATLRSEVYSKGLQNLYGITNANSLEVKTLNQKRWNKSNNEQVQSLAGYIAFSPVSNLNKKIRFYQLAPANWVEMIEHGAKGNDTNIAVNEDLKSLINLLRPDKNTSFQIISEFCTHFPVVHNQIKSTLKKLNLENSTTEYVQQGKIFSKVFLEKIKNDLVNTNKLDKSTTKTKNSSPKIYISGNNIEETKNLVQTIFPNQKEISVNKINP